MEERFYLLLLYWVENMVKLFEGNFNIFFLNILVKKILIKVFRRKGII